MRVGRQPVSEQIERADGVPQQLFAVREIFCTQKERKKVNDGGSAMLMDPRPGAKARIRRDAS
jgi:hypothetical protein